MSSSRPVPLPLDVVILSDGDIAGSAASSRSAAPLVERVTVLERRVTASGPAAIPGARVLECDWQDDAAVSTVVGVSGGRPLVVLGAAEELDILDDQQIRSVLAAGGPLSAEVWTPSGWEVRLQSPGPEAVRRIGGVGDQRVHAVQIVTPASRHRWRQAEHMAVDCPPSSSTFVIVTPGYQQASGGIVALHNLCHRLNRLGRRAVLCPLDEGFQRREGWDTPLAIRADLDDAVVVYPEIIAGNPLQADRVVRWLLNRPGYISGQSMQEEPTDLIVSYSASIDPDRPLLSLPVIDPSIYFPKDVPGSGSLLWVGKGTGRTSMDLSGCREITRTWPATKADLAAVLRGADVLYSLDSLSAVNVEATLCGTPVVLFPDASWDRDALTRYEGGTAGFAWPGEGSGSDELAAARTAVLDAYPAYLQRLSGVDQGVAEFVRHCDEFFGLR